MNPNAEMIPVDHPAPQWRDEPTSRKHTLRNSRDELDRQVDTEKPYSAITIPGVTRVPDTQAGNKAILLAALASAFREKTRGYVGQAQVTPEILARVRTDLDETLAALRPQTGPVTVTAVEEISPDRVQVTLNIPPEHFTLRVMLDGADEPVVQTPDSDLVVATNPKLVSEGRSETVQVMFGTPSVFGKPSVIGRSAAIHANQQIVLSKNGEPVQNIDGRGRSEEEIAQIIQDWTSGSDAKTWDNMQLVGTPKGPNPVKELWDKAVAQPNANGDIFPPEAKQKALAEYASKTGAEQSERERERQRRNQAYWAKFAPISAPSFSFVRRLCAALPPFDMRPSVWDNSCLMLLASEAAACCPLDKPPQAEVREAVFVKLSSFVGRPLSQATVEELAVLAWTVCYARVGHGPLLKHLNGEDGYAVPPSPAEQQLALQARTSESLAADYVIPFRIITPWRDTPPDYEGEWWGQTKEGKVELVTVRNRRSGYDLVEVAGRAADAWDGKPDLHCYLHRCTQDAIYSVERWVKWSPATPPPPRATPGGCRPARQGGKLEATQAVSLDSLRQRLGDLALEILFGDTKQTPWLSAIIVAAGSINAHADAAALERIRVALDALTVYQRQRFLAWLKEHRPHIADWVGAA